MHDVLETSAGMIRFQIAGRDPLLFEALRYRGSEGLSQLYSFEVDLETADGPVDARECIHQAAVLTVTTGHGQRWFHGIVARFEHTGEGDQESYYRARVVPQLWLLTHRYGSRIFQHRSIPQIVEEVLASAGIPRDRFSLYLSRLHAPRDYCVQYRETDFNFVSRLLEEEGLYYYFDQARERCRLIIADSPIGYAAMPGGDSGGAALAYMPPNAMAGEEEHVHRFRMGQEIRPGAVSLRDFNFEKPRLDLHCHSHAGRDAGLEVYDYPGEYDKQGHGHRLAQIRTEEFECQRHVGIGDSNCLRLAPGRVFGLTSHPNTAFNMRFLLTKVSYAGQQAVMRHSGGSDGAEGALGPTVAQTLAAARQHSDASVRNLAESILQLARRLQPSAPEDSETLPRWLYHGGQVGTDAALVAAGLAGDPLERGARHGHPGGAAKQRGDDSPVYACHFECIPASVTYRPARVTPWPDMRGCQTATVVGPKGEEIHTDEHGRVKVQFHWDRDGQRDEKSSCWIRVSQPWAGAGYGGLAIPRIGQEVIVDFLEGDPDRPIVVGRVYNGDQKAPQSMAAPMRMTGRGFKPIAAMQGRVQTLPGSATRTSIRTSSTPGGGGANEITLDDAAGSELVHINATKDHVRTVGNDDTTTVVNDRACSVGRNLDEYTGNFRSKFIGGDESCDVMGDQRERICGARERSILGTDTCEVLGDRSVHYHRNSLTRTGIVHRIVAGEMIELVCGKSVLQMDKDGNILLSGMAVHIQAGDAVSLSSATTTVHASNSLYVGAAPESDSAGEGQWIGGTACDTIVVEATSRISERAKAIGSTASKENVIQGTPIKLN